MKIEAEIVSEVMTRLVGTLNKSLADGIEVQAFETVAVHFLVHLLVDRYGPLQAAMTLNNVVGSVLRDALRDEGETRH